MMMQKCVLHSSKFRVHGLSSFLFLPGFARQVGNSVTAVVGATTANRAKTVKPQLQEIAGSFRVYEGKFE